MLSGSGSFFYLLMKLFNLTSHQKKGETVSGSAPPTKPTALIPFDLPRKIHHCTQRDKQPDTAHQQRIILQLD